MARRGARVLNGAPRQLRLLLVVRGLRVLWRGGGGAAADDRCGACGGEAMKVPSLLHAAFHGAAEMRREAAVLSSVLRDNDKCACARPASASSPALPRQLPLLSGSFGGGCAAVVAWALCAAGAGALLLGERKPPPPWPAALPWAAIALVRCVTVAPRVSVIGI
ncbi:hypothetical protein U9M48_017588 [Paspalum notatum var. saurae]|uniref:Uncharacterized protein n=1 Tax=Paspalum notatum var. saurae TaxID=547442 RepID=A0AAQ3T9S4_PASNO